MTDYTPSEGQEVICYAAGNKHHYRFRLGHWFELTPSPIIVVDPYILISLKQTAEINDAALNEKDS